ncbi:MAG: DUF1326 domain-containing protein [Vicinamibacteria bacterium]|jgi:hypothetical protein
MSWKIEGRYFENCNCNAPCPCTASLDLGADNERCTPVLAFHVDSGEVEGVDVSGLSVVAVADAPQVMTEGNWRLGVFIDAAASDEQAEKLGAVFSGALGGPMEALGPLIGEQLGVERAPIEFASEGGNHRLKVGEAIELEVEDIIPFGSESGRPARMVDIFHPAGSDVALGRAKSSRAEAFGMQFANQPGSSGFSTAFSWAA